MSLYLKTKDFSVTQETFELHLDRERDLLVTKPLPEDLSKYYDSQAYISHTDAKRSVFDKLYQRVKRLNLKRKAGLIRRLSGKQGSLLDIGAGTGDFLRYMEDLGWKTTGMEPNAKARARAKAKNMELGESLDGLSGSVFDVITLWHVLEHIPNLEQTMQRIATMLHDKGHLMVAVPNYRSHDAEWYGTYWAAFDVPRHVWHFSKKAMGHLVAQHGMQIEEIVPMPFDAYYVSLLSERYKGGRSRPFHAFYRGFVSNLKAKRNMQYSSLLYVIKKAK